MATSNSRPWYRVQFIDVRASLGLCAFWLAIMFVFGPALDRLGVIHVVTVVIPVSLFQAAGRLAQNRGRSWLWGLLVLIPTCFAQVVWPTEYFHGELLGHSYRVDRFSGKQEFKTAYGWMTMFDHDGWLAKNWHTEVPNASGETASDKSPMSLQPVAVTGLSGIDASCSLVYLYEDMTVRLSMKTASRAALLDSVAVQTPFAITAMFEGDYGKVFAEKTLFAHDLHLHRGPDGRAMSLEANPTIDISPNKFLKITRWEVVAHR